ncbi:MAG: MCP four helix bundle domain-containing protein, partial [Fibrobacterota bacterium]
MFKNMKIGVRLGLGFGLILAMLVIMSITTIVQMNSISGKLNTVVNDRFPKTVMANEIINNVNVIARAMRNMVILTDSVKILSEDERITEAAKLISDDFSKLEETITTVEGKKVLEAAIDARKDYLPMQSDLRKMILEKKRDAAVAILMGQFRTLQNDYMAKVNALIEFQSALTDKDGDEGLAAAKTAQLTIILIASFILIFSVIAAIFITMSITGPISKCITIADKVAAGDTNVEIKTDSKDETGKLLDSLSRMVNSIRNLVSDAGMLSKAAIDGKLDTRADASKHQGDYRKIVEGVNATLDSVIGPLNVAAEFVDRISKGDIPSKITDTYHGDFNEIKNNLNQCIDAVNMLVTDAKMLSKAAVDGKLDTRADASKHEGDFRKIVQGVNETLDAVIVPLNVAAKYVDDISKGSIPDKITDNYNG